MSKLDWVVAQALGGQAIDDELYRLRAEHEKRLRTEQDVLKALCAEADDLRTKLSSSPNVPTATLDIDGLLSVAKASLVDKKEALFRAEQALAAYRLRHGLTREPEV
ncbi:MAG: hypothetical protein KZQ96_20995 [Candidatus Thiodiazotropha sp. (ex Lucinoma borealis)]|nr:hypothetical protein [Candidatus Thiodiazotropha sp. (ex Lucinoma borealis)]